MLYAIKKVRLRFKNIVLVIAIVFVIQCLDSNKFSKETISISAHGINEDCDDYNHLWEVDSVSNADYEFLIGEILYSKMAAEKLSNNTKNHNRNEKLFAEGQLSKNTHMEHYTCRETWFFLAKNCRIQE